ncbi:MAG: cbb3-type cytochrome c oxidase subunit 3 [Burkholderiales bacterium]
MDVNEIRIAVMVASFFLFLGVVGWAYAPGRRRLLDGIGRHILDDQDRTGANQERSAP